MSRVLAETHLDSQRQAGTLLAAGLQAWRAQSSLLPRQPPYTLTHTSGFSPTSVLTSSFDRKKGRGIPFLQAQREGGGQEVRGTREQFGWGQPRLAGGQGLCVSEGNDPSGLQLLVRA